MTEEAESLIFDLKHTISAMLGQKVERMKFEVICRRLKASSERSGMCSGLHRMTWLRPGMGYSLPSMSFRWLGTSSLRLGASYGSLKKSYVRLMANCLTR